MNPLIKIRRIDDLIKPEQMTEYIKEHKDKVVFYCDPTQDEISMQLPYKKVFKSLITGRETIYKNIEDWKICDAEFIATAIRDVLKQDMQSYDSVDDMAKEK